DVHPGAERCRAPTRENHGLSIRRKIGYHVSQLAQILPVQDIELLGAVESNPERAATAFCSDVPHTLCSRLSGFAAHRLPTATCSQTVIPGLGMLGHGGVHGRARSRNDQGGSTPSAYHPARGRGDGRSWLPIGIQKLSPSGDLIGVPARRG